MIVTEKKIESICKLRGMSREQFAEFIVEDLGGGAYLVKESANWMILDRSSEPPSFVERAKTFAKAAVRHVSAGAPRCTDDQIAARYAICQSCEFLKGGACEKCGCPIRREKKYISKIAWADQSCPVGKWGPEV